jgi:CBS domain containing-hemolysin-like protein
MQMSERSRARRAAALARNAHGTLVTLLLSNMIVNVVISVLTTSIALQSLGRNGLAVAIPAATILLLLFGEIVPKTLGLRRGRPLAELAAHPLGFIAWLLGPVQRGLEVLARAVTGAPSNEPLRREELSTLLSVAQEEGQLTRFETRVLRRMLDLADTPVSMCMTPRVSMITIDVDAGHDLMLQTFESSGRSRLPVVEGGVENVVGILLLKDLFTYEGDRVRLNARSLMRDPVFEPENLSAAQLFRRFQERRLHMAIVVGEHGGVEGLVTLEDLLEEMIGDIRDESDEADSSMEPLPEGGWRADAAVSLDLVAESLDLHPDALQDVDDEEIVTLSGLLQWKLGRVPRAGDRVPWQGWELRVLTASPNRARLVQLRPLGPAEGTDG